MRRAPLHPCARVTAATLGSGSGEIDLRIALRGVLASAIATSCVARRAASQTRSTLVVQVGRTETRSSRMLFIPSGLKAGAVRFRDNRRLSDLHHKLARRSWAAIPPGIGHMKRQETAASRRVVQDEREDRREPCRLGLGTQIIVLVPGAANRIPEL